jgi:hypothetical protein
LFVARDPDAAAHVAYPRIESVIRRVAIARKIPVLQLAYGHIGNIDYLSRLLDGLEASARQVDKAWWRYMRLLLIDFRAGGLRNVLSHGLRGDLGFQESVSRQEAALLLHAAAFLSSLDADGNVPVGSDSPQA